ncbi:energy-coupling factor transporter ATPase [Aerococcaceae bacterium DSM 111020]|nr:energy-coupling factor transporter ATPase [Aerococcaceae bacterium DSM 111020]
MDIQLNNVSYTYDANTAQPIHALASTTLTIQSGTFNAIIGPTGSGKSTLIKLINALLIPDTGTIRIGRKTYTHHTPPSTIKELRKLVGTVIQFPEMQLFGQTVEEDIIFGPMNYGVSKDVAQEIAQEKLQLVGLDNSYLTVSPFDLSGGEQRRVAIAGILALEPEILILDEPTIGLDPKGQKALLDLFKQLNQTLGVTIILISHQMEQVAQYAEQVFVIEAGRLLITGSPQEVFTWDNFASQTGLKPPAVMEIARDVADTFAWPIDNLPLTVTELADMIAKHMKGGSDER